MNSVSVCVIGAGAAGLCAARHLAVSPAVRKVTVFEQNAQVGGTWIYTDDTGMDQHGFPIHSSMYQYMRTNLPKEVMGFPDFPFPEDGPSFVSHRKVCEYMVDYAKNFDLYKSIKFGHRVDTVSFRDKKWIVTSLPLCNPANKSTEEFDALFVCNGHYFAPSIPKISNFNMYEGTVLHSHNYRKPEPFEGMTVLCLGAGPSGMDITLELAKYCKKVYLSHNHEYIDSPLPKNVDQVVGIDSFGKDGAFLLSKDYVHFDAIVFCTGYEIQFPFFDDTVHLSCQNCRVTPLFQHLVHITHPHLYFIGLGKTIVPFPQFDVQVQYTVRLIENKVHLPSVQEMLESEKDGYEFRTKTLGLNEKDAHFMGDMQWPYIQDLSTLGGFENPVAPVIEKLYREVGRRRRKNWNSYKNDNFRILNKFDFKAI